MILPEYDALDAMGLAELVRRGQVSAGELLETAIARIEARNPRLNAVVHTMYERARACLPRLPAGPLHGVPFLLKDLGLQLAGTPTTGSTRLLEGHVAERSSVLAERYEAAGLQLVGKTSTPELGIMGITEPALRGPCRNPWNPEHTPGGSSGGAGAAVAARMVPAAHGGDGGGSIRIPSSACGLFGLKPTRGRVTMAPFAGEGWGGFVQEHALTRSVRDSALFLDVVDAPTPGEPYVAPAKARPWIEEVGAPVGRLRVAFCKEALFADQIHPDCVAAVERAAKMLADLGHEVAEARPQFARDELVRAYFVQMATCVACDVEEIAALAGARPRAKDFEPATWLCAMIGWKSHASELERARRVMMAAARTTAAFFEQHDVFVTATTGQPPARVGQLGLSAAERRQLAVLRKLPLRSLLAVALREMGGEKLAYTPNTQLWNQTGQPAMSVPLHWNDAGLPIGVQVVGRFGGEATLFRLAAQLEAAHPWAERRPPGI